MTLKNPMSDFPIADALLNKEAEGMSALSLVREDLDAQQYMQAVENLRQRESTTLQMMQQSGADPTMAGGYQEELARTRQNYLTAKALYEAKAMGKDSTVSLKDVNEPSLAALVRMPPPGLDTEPQKEAPMTAAPGSPGEAAKAQVDQAVGSGGGDAEGPPASDSPPEASHEDIAASPFAQALSSPDMGDADMASEPPAEALPPEAPPEEMPPEGMTPEEELPPEQQLLAGKMAELEWDAVDTLLKKVGMVAPTAQLSTLKDMWPQLGPNTRRGAAENIFSQYHQQGRPIEEVPQALTNFLTRVSPMPQALYPTKQGEDEMFNGAQAMLKRAKDKIPGGLADKKDPNSFCKRQMRMGRKVEMEHTDSPAVADEISRDHLTEFPTDKLPKGEGYYDELDEMEAEMKDKMKGKKEAHVLLKHAAKPSAGLSKKQKSDVARKARAGKDIGKKGKGFKAVAEKARASGARDPDAVAAAAMWKNIKRGTIEESQIEKFAEAMWGEISQDDLEALYEAVLPGQGKTAAAIVWPKVEAYQKLASSPEQKVPKDSEPKDGKQPAKPESSAPKANYNNNQSTNPYSKQDHGTNLLPANVQKPQAGPKIDETPVSDINKKWDETIGAAAEAVKKAYADKRAQAGTIGTQGMPTSPVQPQGGGVGKTLTSLGLGQPGGLMFGAKNRAGNMNVGSGMQGINAANSPSV